MEAMLLYDMREPYSVLEFVVFGVQQPNIVNETHEFCRVDDNSLVHHLLVLCNVIHSY